MFRSEPSCCYSITAQDIITTQGSGLMPPTTRQVSFFTRVMLSTASHGLRGVCDDVGQVNIIKHEKKQSANNRVVL